MFFLNYLFQYNRYLSLIGIVIILAIAVLFSQNKSKINFKLVFNALLLQFFIGILTLKLYIGKWLIAHIAEVVNSIYQFADHGSKFIFGNLSDASGPWGFLFGIKVLPVIIFFGALMSLLFHWKIIQRIVSAVNFVVQPILGTSGAETLCAISNSFLGQTEAPLLIKNYLKNMTKSEIFVVMVSGMGTISGAILAVFAAMGVPVQHLLTASVMAIPGSILIAKIIYPESDTPQTAAGAKVNFDIESNNALDAIAAGTSDGLKLALNVGAMLISFIAIIAMINSALGFFSISISSVLHSLGITFEFPSLTLGLLFSYIFSPFGFLLGFSGDEAFKAGSLLGAKVTVNELVAYGEMLKMNLSDRTVNIITYALCGFSNFSCIGIQIGGIGALIPEKRAWLTQLGLLAVLGSSLSNLLSAMIVNILI